MLALLSQAQWIQQPLRRSPDHHSTANPTLRRWSRPPFPPTSQFFGRFSSQETHLLSGSCLQARRVDRPGWHLGCPDWHRAVRCLHRAAAGRQVPPASSSSAAPPAGGHHQLGAVVSAVAPGALTPAGGRGMFALGCAGTGAAPPRAAWRQPCGAVLLCRGAAVRRGAAVPWCCRAARCCCAVALLCDRCRCRRQLLPCAVCSR
jgi:hypothetical protein